MQLATGLLMIAVLYMHFDSASRAGVAESGNAAGYRPVGLFEAARVQNRDALRD